MFEEIERKYLHETVLKPHFQPNAFTEITNAHGPSPQPTAGLQHTA